MQKDYLLFACVRQINRVYWIKLLLRMSNIEKTLDSLHLTVKWQLDSKPLIRHM
jgi:hypothetical protein